MKSPMRITFEGDHAEVVVPLEACGWGYANAGCNLHQPARRCDLPRVCDFFAPRGTSPGVLPWYPVSDGLSSVRGLMIELDRSPESVCDAGCSTRDLQAIERALAAAPATRFRLTIFRASKPTTALVES